MKKRHFLLAGLVALLMIGCSDNELNQENQPQVAKDGKMYMKVSISSPTAGSRALPEESENQFENGDEFENAIEEIHFVFYNKNGNRLKASTMTKAQKGSEMNDTQFASGTQGVNGTSIETNLEMIVPVDVNADHQPYYVMAYVNPTTKDQTGATSLNDIFNLTRGENQYKNNKGNFVMNNAVYYSGTDAAAPTNAVVIKKLCQTKEEAQESSETTEIYVERMCAKVKVTDIINAEGKESHIFTNNDDGINVGENLVENMEIKFHPVGWALNATANNSYLVKQFKKTDVTAIPYNTVNNRFDNKFRNAWNAAENHRSYWCTSLYYEKTDYPKVASQYDKTQQNNHLNYLTYKEASSDEYKKIWGNVAYCLEQTVNDVDVPMSANTSVIVFGYYTLNENAEKDFYTLETTTKPIVYEETEDLIKKMAETANALYIKKENVEEYELVGNDKLSAVYELKHPALNVKNDRLIPARYVYLQVKETLPEGEAYYYFDEETKEYEVVNASNKTKVNQQLLLSSTPATKYGNGMVYYNIPIEHFGKLDDGNAGYGTYGVVRNHYYNINIQGITGLGTAIADENDPIIPPTEEQKYYVKTKLNVLAWKLMTTQNVTLGE